MPTTINDELLRIEGAKVDIATAIGGKGVTVPANAKIDDFADLIDAIQTGGGSGDTLLQIMNKTITSVDIPSGVTTIPINFFQSCSNLTSVTIPSSVTSIGNYAFSYSGLTSISIPNTVTSIGHYCFQTCNNLISVDIGECIDSLGNYVFRGCSNISTIIIRNTNCSLGSSTFIQSSIASGTGKIYVPYGYGNTYKGMSNWSAYASQIYELDSNGNIPT